MLDTVIINEEKVTKDQLKIAKDLLNLTAEKLKLSENTQISIKFVDLAESNKYNREYRGIDRPTDVISFAIEEDPDLDEVMLANLGIPRNLGDLIIAPEKIASQASELGHSFERELGYTVVHGMLHLNGFDHQREEDASEMIQIQESLLGEYGLEK